MTRTVTRMSDRDLLALFAELLGDVDSEPFAYEKQWIEWSGDCLKEEVQP